MDCRMPGFPVHHQFLELAQTHVHRVSEAIQPSHPLSSHSRDYVFSKAKHLFPFKVIPISQLPSDFLEFVLRILGISVIFIYHRFCQHLVILVSWCRFFPFLQEQGFILRKCLPALGGISDSLWERGSAWQIPGVSRTPFKLTSSRWAGAESMSHSALDHPQLFQKAQTLSRQNKKYSEPPFTGEALLCGSCWGERGFSWGTGAAAVKRQILLGLKGPFTFLRFWLTGWPWSNHSHFLTCEVRVWVGLGRCST